MRELFAVPPDGSAASRKMNAPLPAQHWVLSYAFGRDSRRVFYSTWSTTTFVTRDILTSVIADEAQGRIGAGFAGAPALAAHDSPGTLLVEDPGRGYRERLSMRFDHAQRAARHERPEPEPDARHGNLGRTDAPR